MNAAILKRFCYIWADHPNLMEPWSQGDYSYASEGRIIVRVARLPDVKENPAAPKLASVPEIIFDHDTVKRWNWTPLPTLPKIKEPVCDECKGTGKIPCGTRAFTTCEECDGKPLPIYYTETFLDVGERRLNAGYLALMDSLPVCQIAPLHGGPVDPLRFKFDDGVGLLMPMRKPVAAQTLRRAAK